ncbi:hypothetical protein ACHAPV_003946 [Trichoderma viride]
MAICVDRGAEAAVRCPMAAQDALGPTDGRDGQGQGLLQVAASRCTIARELQRPWQCWWWISHHSGSSVWVGLQRPRIAVWAHRRMFDHSYASPPGREILIGKRRDEASHDGDMLHAPFSSVMRVRVPRERTYADAFPELELVPVQSTRQRQHLVSSTVLERTGASSDCSIP